MEPVSGGDRYITWLPHPDPLVERMFRDADRAGYTIVRVKGLYMLVTPDVLDDYYFVGRVVPSSAAWRHMVRELRDWLESTGRRHRKGRYDHGFQYRDQGGRHWGDDGSDDRECQGRCLRA